jgi:hypothetical protein
LTDVPLDVFNKQLNDFATSHFLFAKAVLPLLKKSEESSHTIITGGAGDQQETQMFVHFRRPRHLVVVDEDVVVS